MEKVLLETNLSDLKLLKRGKVRDIYDPGDNLLIVATDRISAFDVVLPNGIPGKGKVLNQISLMWFDITSDIAFNHLITGNLEDFPEECRKYPELDGRSMIVEKTNPLPVEDIVRGYLSGSGWKEYQKNGAVCGIKLPGGLVESSKIPGKPIFTPSTKEEGGLHDRNIPFDEMADILQSKELAERLKNISLDIYYKAWSYAIDRGIIIADTKLEFGYDEKNGTLMLIDELLTPDSSRFWSLKNYKPGGPQDSYDKQPVRDYLVSKGWKGAEDGPAPELPEWLIKQTSERYQEILAMLQP